VQLFEIPGIVKLLCSFFFAKIRLVRSTSLQFLHNLFSFQKQWGDCFN
jgi:hypothetical protein